jgi:hypothetical protein
MKIKIDLTGDQEDKIVAKSIKQTYERLCASSYSDSREQEDSKAIRFACRLLYHYYTAKTLK